MQGENEFLRNDYIEAFHSIVQREVIDRFEFAVFMKQKQHFLHTNNGIITFVDTVD